MRGLDPLDKEVGRKMEIQINGTTVDFRPNKLALRSPVRKAVLQHAKEVLAEDHPMTVRQVYYRMVALKVVPNKKGAYKQVQEVLNDARLALEIPFEWIEDRGRNPLELATYPNVRSSLTSLAEHFRLDPWRDQPTYIEVWTEKDALSGVFWQAVGGYGVVVDVCKGYTSLSALTKVVVRFQQRTNDWKKPAVVLYVGDLDPSGWDMPRDLRERLDPFNFPGEIVRLLLNPEDVEAYDLPDSVGGVGTKIDDPRYKRYVEHFGRGARCVELDAVVPAELRSRVQSAVLDLLDGEALERTWKREKRAAAKLRRIANE